MSTGQVIFDIVVGVLSLYSVVLGIINRRMLNRRQIVLRRRATGGQPHD